MNDIITIDPAQLIVAQDSAGEITLTPEARHEIQKIITAKKMIDEVYARVEEVLGSAMEGMGLKKIVAGNIVVSRRLTGDRFEITNPNLVAENYTRKVIYVKPNADNIEAYVAEHGSVPPGIANKIRNSKTTFAERTNI